jgi:hypothetical protein
MLKIFLILFVLLFPGMAQLFVPISVVKVNEIDLAYPTGGAFEHAKLVLDEIGSDPDYAQMIAKPTTKNRVYGDATPSGWYAYTAQDAKSSWMGDGMAAYALWS